PPTSIPFPYTTLFRSDWIVLTQLTDEDATALGICMALQLGPQLLLFPVAGTLADRFRRRWMLLLTQILQGSMGLILFTLTVTNRSEEHTSELQSRFDL